MWKYSEKSNAYKANQWSYIFISNLCMFPLILLREILSVLTDWLWYWKLSVSMMSKTLHCIFLQIKTIMSVLKVLTYIMTSIRSSYLAIMSVLIFISDYCHWKPSYQEKKVEISFTGLTPYFCACPKLGPGFHMSWSFLHSMSSVEMRSDCSSCWYWWNWWTSLFILSFHYFILYVSKWQNCLSIIIGWFFPSSIFMLINLTNVILLSFVL